MKVYLAFIKENHIPAYAEPFATAESAVEYVKTWAKKHAHTGKYEELKIPGLLFKAHYSPSDDRYGGEETVWVVEKELRTA